jgi:propionyl-CoA synthetase
VQQRYAEVYAESIDRPEAFWSGAAEAIDWYRFPETVFDDTNEPFFRWFPDGELNTCHNALDRHVDNGRADQTALIYDSPVTGTQRTFTYRELRDAVARFAGALRDLGAEKGDTAVIYMPMVPHAVIAMLACARLGVVHSVVFGGFAAKELAIRIDDAKPKLVISASCGIEVTRIVEYKPLLDEALEIAEHRPDRCVILQRPQAYAKLVEGRDITWEAALENAAPAACVGVAATDPLYILYTSGTTGRPKGVVRDNGGHAVALRWSMPNLYGVEPGDIYWAASDVGWVVGHSYIVYAPLLTGCTTVLYEGKPVGTPDAGAFWRVIAEHRVNALFTAPTAIRAIKREDPGGALRAPYDLSPLRYLFLAGERLDPDTYHWATDLLGVPVIDHWWQTETGWPVATNPVGIEQVPIKPGSAALPVPGYVVDIIDETGAPLPPGTDGTVAIKLPLPPGTLPTLWNDDARFVESYLSMQPGYYLTGDGGNCDEDGYLSILGRIDDVINVAGHRLSTGAMEEVLATHPAVAECAVIGVANELKGQVPLGLAVLKADAEIEPAVLQEELVAMVRRDIGPVASFKTVIVVDRLPKTRSGKVLRRTMRAIADGKEYGVPSTIEDPAVLDEIDAALGSRGSPSAS